MMASCKSSLALCSASRLLLSLSSCPRHRGVPHANGPCSCVECPVQLAVLHPCAAAPAQFALRRERRQRRHFVSVPVRGLVPPHGPLGGPRCPGVVLHHAAVAVRLWRPHGLHHRLRLQPYSPTRARQTLHRPGVPPRLLPAHGGFRGRRLEYFGTDHFLVSFSAGCSFNHDGWFRRELAETRLPHVIDLLLNNIFFVYFGAVIPWG